MITLCIALLLTIQQFYIPKIMMLVFTIIVMHSYLYSMWLLCLVLKNTYFKEHTGVIASKYSICNMENNRNLNYCFLLFKLRPNGEGMLFGSSGIQPQWKSIMVPMEYSPMEEAWFYIRLFFEVVMVMVKDKRKYNKKIQCL